MTTPGTRHLCIYGHFYQPPREDPFTGSIPREFGAEPFHDFNEKITAECYLPNARLGSFAQIGFDLGPTLASWMQTRSNGTLRRIVRQERQHYAAHGVPNALAQAYSHAILPLCSEREKRIQIAWGIADFEQRFGHSPQGMWLPETAADEATLGALLDHGISYTVLAPWQSRRKLDTTEPYWIELADGRRIAAFFYDGPLSGRVSFDAGTTSNADVFGYRDLPSHVNAAKVRRGEAQIITVATDGELYGHHQVHRDLFLTHLLNETAPRQGFVVTTLGRYLRDHPPTRSTRLAGPSSWSCHHGVQRWRGACACTEGDGRWKAGLRRAITALGAQLDLHFDQTGAGLFHDPRQAELEYVNLRLGRVSRRAFWELHGTPGRAGSSRAMRLLEAQYHRHLMLASCAWFFDDLDRIEPRNAIAHGLRAARIAERVHGLDLTSRFAGDLRGVKSWRTARTGFDLLRELASRACETERASGAALTDRRRAG
ncbi:MAG: DUF3536 domain-containing protein [Chloroflexota bacterium]